MDNTDMDTEPMKNRQLGEATWKERNVWKSGCSKQLYSTNYHLSNSTHKCRCPYTYYQLISDIIFIGASSM